MFQIAERAMSGVEMDMSGDDGGWLLGSLVWVFVLSVQRFDCVICWDMSAPLVSARFECQSWSCALKSPRMRVVFVVFRRGFMSGLYPWGQEEDGGM